MDLLVDAAILGDDSWQVVPALALHFGGVEPQKARAEVQISDAAD